MQVGRGFFQCAKADIEWRAVVNCWNVIGFVVSGCIYLMRRRIDVDVCKARDRERGARDGNLVLSQLAE